MPVTRAQKIAQDLIRLDSLSAEHGSLKFILGKTESKITVKDSIIKTNTEKIDTYLKEIGAHEEKFKTASNRISALEIENSELKDKNQKLQSWIKGLGGGLIATLTTLISVIAIK